jgi:hypothetical protein
MRHLHHGPRRILVPGLHHLHRGAALLWVLVAVLVVVLVVLLVRRRR